MRKTVNRVERREPAGELVSAREYRRALGISDVTLWRWTRAGHFTPVNIAGKNYLRRSEISAFEERAIAGQLARKPVGALAGRGGAAS